MTHLPLFDPPTVKVLSVRQPWAHLILSGQKPIENRTWTTRYRGPLYIHAGVNMHAMPVTEIEVKFGIAIDRSALTLGAIIGRVTLVDVVTGSQSPWFDGPYGWVFEKPEIINPTPYRGQMGLFDAPQSIVA